jgi:Amt family ammonium transporter
MAEEAVSIEDLSATVSTIAEGLDVFYLLFAGALVFSMQAGFAMLCAGSVRQKNVKNIMLKNLLDACGGAIGFYLMGYGIAYGDGGLEQKRFLGTYKNFALAIDTATDPSDPSAGYALITFFFQWAFAATAATIVAGTVAERCKMAAYICYSMMLTGFVYPVVVFWGWSSYGYLSAFSTDPFLGTGAIDFAGSGIVHMTGGMTALIAAVILGPRIGRFYDADGNPLPEPKTFNAHSSCLQCLGTFILWFGWYGFNPGSTLGISGGNYTAALCAVTTTMGAASGALSCMFTQSFIDHYKTGEFAYDITCVMNGALAGLVAITAGCAVVTPWAAVIIGVIAGWVYIGADRLLIALRIDDAVNAVPVHFANGMWALIATGLFARPEQIGAAYSGYADPSVAAGLFYGGIRLLGANVCLLLFVVGWVSLTMIPFFYVLNYFNMFRVDPLEEEVGLDISHHKGSAYDYSGPDTKAVEELEVRRSQHGGKVEVPMAEENPEEAA